MFTLSAFDQELIVARQVGTYNTMDSPLRVDGHQQDYHAQIPDWGHRHRLTTAWDEPAEGRWHDSENLTLAETRYAGPFEVPEISVTHDRQVILLKPQGVWVVIDSPRPEGVAGFASVESVGETDPDGYLLGFVATLEDGTRVDLRIQTLTADTGATAEEIVLRVSGPDEDGYALVLGAASDEAREVIGSSGVQDAEVILTEGRATSVIPVHRPLQPVQIAPAQPVFYESLEIELSSRTEGVDIRYTLDGSEPMLESTLYDGPFVIDEDTVIKARAFRPGVETVPDVMSGTESTPIARAFYTRQALRAPVTPEQVQSRLRYMWYEGRWQDLFTELDQQEPVHQGVVPGLFDPAPDRSDTAYAIRYEGYIEVTEPGVYSFHAPETLIRNHIMGGYDLRIYIGDEQWYPSTRRHAFGVWSVALDAGLHPLRVDYIDFREDAPERHNEEGQNERIWSGTKPDLRISGPGRVHFRR